MKLAESRTGMRTFSARDGRQLSYEVRGSGPLMVMIPGGPGMDPQAYYAAADIEGLRQVIFCPRGPGSSYAPSDPTTCRVADRVSDLEDLRAHLGADRWTRYGSGHGVLTALAYADRRPHDLSHLILANGPACFDTQYQALVAVTSERFAQRVPDGALRLRAAAAAEETMDVSEDAGVRRLAYQVSLAGLVAHLTGTVKEHVDQLGRAPFHLPAVAPTYDELLRGLNLLDAAARIPTPTLVLSGELDPVVPTEHMSLLAETLPGGRHTCFEGVGHFPAVEAHDDWSRIVGTFVASASPRDRERAS